MQHLRSKPAPQTKLLLEFPLLKQTNEDIPNPNFQFLCRMKSNELHLPKYIKHN